MESNYKPRHKKGSRPTNNFRAKMRAYAVTQSICTQCFSAESELNRVQCLVCINRVRTKRGATPFEKKKPKQTDEERKHKKNEYQRVWRKKKLVKKVTNLDRIRYAVENGREL
jgi:hypothetical protein